jgi:hypothetical protein
MFFYNVLGIAAKSCATLEPLFTAFVLYLKLVDLGKMVQRAVSTTLAYYNAYVVVVNAAVKGLAHV